MAQWAQTIQARMSSGQKIEEFCEEAGISRQTYFYWQRKVREAACLEMSTGAIQGVSVPEGWTRLGLREASTGHEDVGIEVGGCRVVATTQTNMELLVKICGALKAL